MARYLVLTVTDGITQVCRCGNLAAAREEDDVDETDGARDEPRTMKE